MTEFVDSLSLCFQRNKLLPDDSNCKESDCNAGDSGLVPGLERFPGSRKWQPTPGFLLENSIDKGAWRATVHGISKNRTQLSG